MVCINQGMNHRLYLLFMVLLAYLLSGGVITFQGGTYLFSAKLLSAHILVRTVSPLSMFFSFKHYFYKKLSHFTHISKIYLRLGFEFGPLRIKDLATVCPYVVCDQTHHFVSYKRLRDYTSISFRLASLEKMKTNQSLCTYRVCICYHDTILLEFIQPYHVFSFSKKINFT